MDKPAMVDWSSQSVVGLLADLTIVCLIGSWATVNGFFGWCCHWAAELFMERELP
jgi:hypothetical protein